MPLFANGAPLQKISLEVELKNKEDPNAVDFTILVKRYSTVIDKKGNSTVNTYETVIGHGVRASA